MINLYNKKWKKLHFQKQENCFKGNMIEIRLNHNIFQKKKSDYILSQTNKKK